MRRGSSGKRQLALAPTVVGRENRFRPMRTVPRVGDVAVQQAQRGRLAARWADRPVTSGLDGERRSRTAVNPPVHLVRPLTSIMRRAVGDSGEVNSAALQFRAAGRN